MTVWETLLVVSVAENYLGFGLKMLLA